MKKFWAPLLILIIFISKSLSVWISYFNLIYTINDGNSNVSVVKLCLNVQYAWKFNVQKCGPFVDLNTFNYLAQIYLNTDWFGKLFKT